MAHGVSAIAWSAIAVRRVSACGIVPANTSPRKKWGEMVAHGRNLLLFCNLGPFLTSNQASMSRSALDPVCNRCGDELVRVRRSHLSRIFFSAVYRCRGCERDFRVPHLAFKGISMHSCCPRCGSFRLERLRKRDRIESLSHSPVSFLQMLLGAPISWCPLCRLQFYDFRPRMSRRPASAKHTS